MHGEFQYHFPEYAETAARMHPYSGRAHQSEPVERYPYPLIGPLRLYFHRLESYFYQLIGSS